VKERFADKSRPMLEELARTKRLVDKEPRYRGLIAYTELCCFN
jgi:hypothetical protein